MSSQRRLRPVIHRHPRRFRFIEVDEIEEAESDDDDDSAVVVPLPESLDVFDVGDFALS